jgi:hypothetical protein
MNVAADCSHELFMEIGTQPSVGSPPLHRESIQPDLADLAEEAFVGAVLSDKVPGDADLHIEIAPLWREEPVVDAIEVRLTSPSDGAHIHSQRFHSGRWVRRAQRISSRLREDAVLALEESAWVHVLGERNGARAELALPRLQAPQITDQSLGDLGVRHAGEGELCPDRPVLVNERMLEEILRHTEQAGASEIGGATLGKMVRLREPLHGTTTRVVTVLTASLTDARHVGELSRFTFDPEALQEAAQIAALRGMGETVLTAFHSHGWGRDCRRCNQSDTCALPEATHVSSADYQVLESLFPSKATLMPIAGRKLGAEGDRPILEVHAWRGGRMMPIRWRTYRD